MLQWLHTKNIKILRHRMQVMNLITAMATRISLLRCSLCFRNLQDALYPAFSSLEHASIAHY